MSNTLIDCACGAKDAPDWNGKGQCITCARDAVLAKPQANRLDERVVYELKNLIHKDACEVMCGWSDKCDKDENCVPLRKRIAELLKENK